MQAERAFHRATRTLMLAVRTESRSVHRAASAAPSFFKIAFRSRYHAENPIAAFAFGLVALVQRGHLCDSVSDMDPPFYLLD